MRPARSSTTRRRAGRGERQGRADPGLGGVAARARFGVDVAHEARSELVGRERELDVVATRSSAPGTSERHSFLRSSAFPGIGKSRLVYELSRIVDADPDLITWRQGRCLAYGDGVTLWALGEIVKAQAGILEQDTPEEPPRRCARLSRSCSRTRPTRRGWSRTCSLSSGSIRERSSAAIAGRGVLGLAPLLRGPRRAPPARPRLRGPALGGREPPRLRRRARGVGDRRAAARRRDRPTGAARTPPGLGRREAERDDARRSPRSPKSRPRCSRSAPRQPCARRGVAARAPRARRRQSALRRAVRRALPRARLDGRAAAAGDAPGHHRRPPRRARAGREAAAPRRGCRREGVLGRCARPRRAMPSTATLHALERKGFVRRQRRSSVEGESEFAFAHALVRDVAYGQIARPTGRRSTAESPSGSRASGRPEDHAEMLAHHWRSALELARAAGRDDDELADRARLALREAGDRAFSLNAFASAERYYAEALELWPEDDPDDRTCSFDVRRALHLAGDERRRAGARGSARCPSRRRTTRDGRGEPRRSCPAAPGIEGTPRRADARISRARGARRGASRRRRRRLASSAFSARFRMLADSTTTRSRSRTRRSRSPRRSRSTSCARMRSRRSGRRRTVWSSASRSAEMEEGARDRRDANSPIAGDPEQPRRRSPSGQATCVARRSSTARPRRSPSASATGTASLHSRERIHTWCVLGRWDEAFEAADEFIAECAVVTPLPGGDRPQGQGVDSACPGRHDGALDDSDGSLAQAREIKDPQTLLPPSPTWR